MLRPGRQTSQATTLALVATLAACPRDATQPASSTDAAPPAAAPAARAVAGLALPDLSVAAPFGGVDPRPAAELWRHWHLVTVRYRKDNGEQRFIYANDIAWRALEAGAATYPDGAMFGKVATLTAADPLFPNSVVPSSTARVQLMQKDTRRWPDTGGWGYALYLARPPAHPEDESVVVRACDACHRIAQARDFVFARPAFGVATTAIDEIEPGFAARFRYVNEAALGPVAKRALGAMDTRGAALVNTMPLFAGALAESVGPVVELAASRARPGDGDADGAQAPPVLLVDEERGLFLAARAIGDGAVDGCGSAVSLAMTLATERGLAIRRGRSCEGVVAWDPLPP